MRFQSLVATSLGCLLLGSTTTPCDGATNQLHRGESQANLDASSTAKTVTPEVVVVASKNYEGEGSGTGGTASQSQLQGPLRVISTNYDADAATANAIHLQDGSGGLGKAVPDALAGPGYIVASRTGLSSNKTGACQYHDDM